MNKEQVSGENKLLSILKRKECLRKFRLVMFGDRDFKKFLIGKNGVLALLYLAIIAIMLLFIRLF